MYINKYRGYILWLYISLILGIVSNSYAAEEIAYLGLAKGYWQVWVTNVKGTNHRQITHDAIDKTRVSWSPNRTEVLVNRNDGTLVRVNVKDHRQYPVSLPLNSMLDAQWSPDGKWVAFSQSMSQSMDNKEIWIARLDGTGQRKLTSQPGMEQLPCWNNNGKQIVYSAGSGREGHEIWRINLNSGENKQLTVLGGNKFDPACSTSEKIAYTVDTGGNFDIWVKENEKAVPVRLTNSLVYEGQPTWSPDGRKIAFYSLKGNKKRIWVMDSDGKNQRSITPQNIPARYPAW